MGIVFSPLMWLIGVSTADIIPMGQLLGIKLSVNEFIAYMQLADFQMISSEIKLTYEKSLIMAKIKLKLRGIEPNSSSLSRFWIFKELILVFS